jgi:hypothetical protein
LFGISLDAKKMPGSQAGAGHYGKRDQLGMPAAPNIPTTDAVDKFQIKKGRG